ncbi:MAG: hypothetical protein Q9194_001848 [Teloschistes cf. exilis]
MPGSEEVGTQSASETALPGAPPAASENPPPNEDGRNPFYSDSLDEESIAPGVSSPPKAFDDRLKSLFKLRKSPSSEFTGDAERDQLINSLDQYVAGYPKVAAYENSDPDFLIYRKFGWLHNRVLLYLQDELAEFEYRLEKLEKRTFAEENAVQLKSRRLYYVDCPLRRRNVQLITERLELYGQLSCYPKILIYLARGSSDVFISLSLSDKHLLRFQKIQAIPRPTIRNQTSVFNFIRNTDSLVYEEYEWIKQGINLAALALMTGNTAGSMASLKIFRTKEQRIIAGHENVSLVSPFRLDILMRIIQTILATILLLVPVGILIELQPTHRQDVRRNSRYQILTIFIFTWVFSASCSIFTKPRRGAVFTATAAYFAVLAVFLGSTMDVLTGG